MRATLALITLLVSAISVNAQHKWSGHMKDPENQVIPNRPPSAVCKDGTLAYQKVPGELENICKDHKGIKSWVKNQYLGLDERAANGVNILTVAAPTIKFVPEKENVPEFWLKPVETELTAKGGSTKVNAPRSQSIWLIKLKTF